ncbi:ribonuclease P protein subunit [Metallosphaera hakonensis]|uniref:ribonuclease P protein subunit n=1 Tax=Metallosphaera hakonensis TaxID=79601 RepID=UPI002093A645|nr:ribonuclease P protein subunit [Metallosphaera hakonensis]
MILLEKNIRIISYSDPYLVGKTGIVLLETERTLLIDDGQSRFIVFKSNGVFELDFKRHRVCICGEALVGKPVKRLR